MARLLERGHSELVVSDMMKPLRAGKIFVDWSQNDDYKTTVCVYSLRAKSRPTVSTPVSWAEVEKCVKKVDPGLLVFTSDQVLERVGQLGDLFAPVLNLKQKLPPLEALDRFRESNGVERKRTKPSAPEMTAATREQRRVRGASAAASRKTVRSSAKAKTGTE
jgi:bifunctional non-homologous end joining protein LigD